MDDTTCKGCMRCVAVCPGLAVTLVDFRKDPEFPHVILPFEVGEKHIKKGEQIIITDVYGDELDTVKVERVSKLKDYKQTALVQVRLHKYLASRAVGVRLQPSQIGEPDELYYSDLLPDDAIICRCERVTVGEIKHWINKGIRDMNQLKAITRAGMGACGAKTCRELILRLFREQGIEYNKITDRVDRPLFIEVPLGAFAHVVDKYHNWRR
jgi:ferredoxin